MSNAADLGSASLGGNFIYAGPNNSTGSIYNGVSTGSALQNYAGTANLQAGITANLSNQNLFQSYSGYAISFTGTIANEIPANRTLLMDNLPVLTWPKDQKIYYKLTGLNTSTQTFETWVISEEIVPRPETFDPTGNFPNIDYNVFFTPPSGNKLVNIKIVGRWIQ